MKVQLFIPCFVDQLYPDVGFSMVYILEKLGCEVLYNPKQTCCGQPAYNAGFMKEARVVSEKFLDDFSGEAPIVAPSGSCIGYVRGCLDEMFENSGRQKEAQQVSKKAFEFSEFVVNHLKVTDLGASLNTVVTYHDACGALRECGIRDTPRQLLQQVKGLELREMKEAETCCGFGGTFAVKYEPISIGMSQTKVSSALETGADYIVSTDISCLMHLEGYIRHEKLPIKTIHLAQLLHMAMTA